MPSFIVIEKSKSTSFCSEAETVLEANGFSEVHPGTFSGSSGASSVASQLKKLESYKKNKSSARLKIYNGNLSA